MAKNKSKKKGTSKDDEVKYRLTPKGCAVLALIKADLVNDIDDPRIDVFYKQYEETMRRCGYVKEEDDG